jgi:hypothetical protein
LKIEGMITAIEEETEEEVVDTKVVDITVAVVATKAVAVVATKEVAVVATVEVAATVVAVEAFPKQPQLQTMILEQQTISFLIILRLALETCQDMSTCMR